MLGGIIVRFEKVRNEVIKTGISMIKNNMTVGTWGNISSRVEGEELMAVTPSGVDYEIIKPEDIVIMDFDGNVVEGTRKPSMDFLMHGTIYKNRSGVGAIVHSHSEYTTAFAIARKPIPAAAEDMIEIVGGDVRVSEYKLPGDKELGEAAVKSLRDRSAAILANHGCVAVGRTLKEALKTVLVVEKSAKAVVFAKSLGRVVTLGKDDIDNMRDFYLNHYGQEKRE